MSQTARHRSDIIILGAGAAGLMSAAVASQRGRSVVVLEAAEAPGKKILISGGGRCNFTNLHCTPEDFLSANPHFVKSALARYAASDFIALVEKHRISYHEKKLGQLFCDGSSRQIVDLLLRECAPDNSRIVLNVQVVSVRRTDHFVVETSKGTFESQSLVVATGGLSIPKIGATSFGYELASQFGHSLQPCRPALVPLTLSEKDRSLYSDLAGVAADVRAASGPARFDERLLFTHLGVSGPAVLQISSYWSPGNPVKIDLLPQVDFESEVIARRQAGEHAQLKTLLSAHLPNRLASRLFETWLSPDEPLPAIESKLHNWRIHPSGTEGYNKAEVTAGGVDTRELSSKTLESRKVPGLFFIGEVVDVTGHLGGFNFQWAWSSGYACGQAA